MLKDALNYLGGMPDRLFQRHPEFMLQKNPLSKEEYLGRLRFYDTPEVKEEFLHLPDDAPDVEKVEERPYRDGTFEAVRYPSRYRPANPAVAPEFDSFERNRNGWLHLWRHGDERPLVICVHGFMMGDVKRSYRMFKIDSLYKKGVDVALFNLPHHGRRAQNRDEQHLLMPQNAPLTVEGFGQAVHDLHSAVLLLKEHMGYTKSGIIGASMGGFTSLLYATLSAPVEFMFLPVPAVTLYRSMSPRDGLFSFSLDDEVRKATRQALDLVTPLKHTPLYDTDRICVVAHQGDRICPYGHIRELVDKWGIENFVSLVGGHWLYLDRSARGRAWYGWLDRFGFLQPGK